MKKSIGLTANILEYRPNLPQTKHLNYFMGTNPGHMAGGGDVKAGIPNYPDVNVTRGFLPAALGFAPGGDTGEKKSILDAIISILARQFNKLENDEEIINAATDIVNNQPALAKKLLTQDEAYSVEIPEERIAPKADEIWPTDTITPIDTAKAPEGLPPSHPDFPGKTTTPYDVAKERISKQPELGHWLQDKSIGKFDSVKPLGKDEQNLMKAGVG